MESTAVGITIKELKITQPPPIEDIVSDIGNKIKERSNSDYFNYTTFIKTEAIDKQTATEQIKNIRLFIKKLADSNKKNVNSFLVSSVTNESTPGAVLDMKTAIKSIYNNNKVG